MEASMFGVKTYHCVCHGCGTIHAHKSEFLSVPMSFAFPVNDGVQWCLPMLGCPTCTSEPSVIGPDGRYVGRIRDAYVHGMTPDARARALSEFPAWLPALEASRAR
jgi:hypothetical protein